MANDLLKLKMFNLQAFQEKFGNGINFNNTSGLEMPNPAGPQGDSSGFDIGNIAEGLGELSPQDDLNQKFMDRNKNISRNIQGFNKVSDLVSNLALKSGNPIAMLAGAGLMAGSALNKSATDEFGIVKDRGKAIAAGLLNPITGLSTAFGQKERREAKTQFVNTEIASKRAENQVAGNKITNAIPQYTPPSYGRFGKKLTKFTR